MRRQLLAAGVVISLLPSGAQQSRPKFAIGITMIGLAACQGAPVFIGGVTAESPAARAGLEPGDQLIAVDGDPVRNFHDASSRISSMSPDPVTITIRRAQVVKALTVPREPTDLIWSHSGLRLLDDGLVVSADSTSADIAEIRRVTTELGAEIDEARSRGDLVNIFPGHYPANKNLYYPGFELFVWDHGQQVHVGGIEDGPAKKMGVRWGDRIVSVDGQDPRGKSIDELESLFASSHPKQMHLTIERSGRKKLFAFPLTRATDVMKTNHWKMAQGKLVPNWLPDDLASCFD